MPTYEFVCEECNAHFTRSMHFNENGDDIVCPRGHRNVRKIFSAPSIVFKGSGFYCTDNRPKQGKTG